MNLRRYVSTSSLVNAFIVIVAALLIALVFAVLVWDNADERAEAARTRRFDRLVTEVEHLSTEVGQLRVANEALAAQLKGAGLNPIVEVESEPSTRTAGAAGSRSTSTTSRPRATTETTAGPTPTTPSPQVAPQTTTTTRPTPTTRPLDRLCPPVCLKGEK